MTFILNSNFEEASDSVKWDQIRIWRDEQLRLSDWTQLPDAPVNKVDWAEYRQALRDLPSQDVSPNKVKFPEKP
jgi:hypothetical protein